MKDIIIVGAGGFGREVEWLIERINFKCACKIWNVLGYADDAVEIGKKVGYTKVVCNTDELLSYTKATNVVIAIGNVNVRKKIYEKLSANVYLNFPNIIDPDAIVDNDVKLGIGNIVCAGTIATVNVNLGNFNIINLNCTLGHDDVLNDFVTIYPNANVSGCVIINDMVEIGTGTQIIQGKKIVSNVIIGAGAAVVKDVEEPGTYVGVPAKNIYGGK